MKNREVPRETEVFGVNKCVAVCRKGTGRNILFTFTQSSSGVEARPEGGVGLNMEGETS